MAMELTCPNCGGSVYSTDLTCISCGKPLPHAQLGKDVLPRVEEPTPVAASPAPKAPPSPSACSRGEGYRPLPMVTGVPWYRETVERMDSWWHIYPWVAVIFPVIAWFFLPASGAPDGVLAAAIVLSGLLTLGSVFWIIVDIMANQASWGWLFAFFFAYPIGFILYLFMGRD
jgi:hypothetical protein